MITTDDEDVARELRSLVNQGRSDNGDWLVHQRLGFNFRMDEMSAAVGIAQLEKLPAMLAERAARRRPATASCWPAIDGRRAAVARARTSAAGSSTTSSSTRRSTAPP